MKTKLAVGLSIALLAGVSSAAERDRKGCKGDSLFTRMPETHITELLRQDPGLKVHVVGHTDNVGLMANNMKLSQDRAAAVVSALVSKYGVAAARLKAAGVGSLVPVSTNRSEAGKAKNRRVELVEQ